MNKPPGSERPSGNSGPALGFKLRLSPPLSDSTSRTTWRACFPTRTFPDGSQRRIRRLLDRPEPPPVPTQRSSWPRAPLKPLRRRAMADPPSVNGRPIRYRCGWARPSLPRRSDNGGEACPPHLPTRAPPQLAQSFTGPTVSTTNRRSEVRCRVWFASTGHRPQPSGHARRRRGAERPEAQGLSPRPSGTVYVRRGPGTAIAVELRSNDQTPDPEGSGSGP